MKTLKEHLMKSVHDWIGYNHCGSCNDTGCYGLSEDIDYDKLVEEIDKFQKTFQQGGKS